MCWVCNMWLCECVDFVMFVVCICGVGNVCFCVFFGFLMCECVYVLIL